MLSASFLVYLPDPFGLNRSEFYLRLSDGTAGIVDGKVLEAIETTVITLEAGRFISDLRALGYRPPRDLVDLTEALRLWRGRAKGDGGAKASDPWRLLKSVVQDHDLAAAITIFRPMFEAQDDWPEHRADRLVLFEAVGIALELAWKAVRSGLEETKELHRFEDVERPLANIFYSRQSRGLRLDVDRIRLFIDRADREKYTAYNILAETLGVSPSGLSFRNVKPHLEKIDAAHLIPFVDTPNFEEYVRLAANFSTFAEHLVTLIRTSRDLRALARLRGQTNGIAHPEFQIMGTVTARILVSNPSLQHLRRQYRSVIAAAEGARLAYVDFAQFEPGILASLSKDSHFIERYNKGDIYTELAVAIFEDADKRDVAKRMFLSFSYGMSPERIVASMGGDNPKERLASFEYFVSKFPGVVEFRKARETALEREGHVDTLMGNRRYRTGSGALKADERRWAVSQSVQGTASLIFKEAVLNIAQRLGEEAILLPMHDAVLVQLPESNYDEDVRQVKDIMVSSMQKRCPQIVSRVVATDHF